MLLVNGVDMASVAGSLDRPFVSVRPQSRPGAGVRLTTSMSSLYDFSPKLLGTGTPEVPLQGCVLLELNKPLICRTFLHRNVFASSYFSCMLQPLSQFSQTPRGRLTWRGCDLVRPQCRPAPLRLQGQGRHDPKRGDPLR